MRYVLVLKMAALVIFLLPCAAQVPYAPGHGPADNPQFVAAQIAAKHASSNFVPSLHAREATEFLLTPALLVQRTRLKEPVQFDATLQLQKPSSPSEVTLFARYWVASNFYAVGVVWAEPHGRFLEFAVYPASLQIVSSDRVFSIDHSLFTNSIGSFDKPIAPQEVFTNQFGDFPIASIRFAEARAAWNPLFSEVQHPERGIIPATPIQVALSGGGARVAIDGTNYHVREFTGVDLRGGRTFELNWRRFEQGSDSLNLPESISIGLTNGHVLFRANVSNVRSVSISAHDLQKSVQKFAGFTDADLRYRVLLDRYWKKNPSDVTEADQTEARHLLKRYAADSREENGLGNGIKRLNILMELNRIVGDEEAHARCFDKYLNALREKGLNETMLLGGQVAVDTLMIWQRTREAKRLMTVWVEHVRKVEAKLIVAFVKRELERGNIVTTLFLLDHIRDVMPPEYKQDLEALRAKTAEKALALLADSQLNEPNEIAAGQLALAKAAMDLKVLTADFSKIN